MKEQEDAKLALSESTKKHQAPRVTERLAHLEQCVKGPWRASDDLLLFLSKIRLTTNPAIIPTLKAWLAWYKGVTPTSITRPLRGFSVAHISKSVSSQTKNITIAAYD